MPSHLQACEARPSTTYYREQLVALAPSLPAGAWAALHLTEHPAASIRGGQEGGAQGV